MNNQAEKEENKAPANATNPPPPVVVEDQEAGKDQINNNMSAEKAILGKKMVEISTILTIILSLPIIFMPVWLLYMKGFDCENLLRMQNLQVGISWFMIAIFLVSNALVFFRARFPIPGLLLVMVPLLVMFTVGLALAGTYKLESRSIKGSPMWFKSKVYDHNLWNEIESCLYHSSKACSDLIQNSNDLPTTRLSAIQSGCCRPPTTCEMEHVNATFWLKKNGAVDDPDCDLWENDQTTMCYNCNSCKLGFYTTLKSKWWRIGVFLVSMAILLVVSHLLLFFSTMWERYNQI